MTQKESERIARVEENQHSTNEKLDYLIDRFDEFVKQSNQTFITRLEGKVAIGAITLMISILAFWFSHFGKAQ